MLATDETVDAIESLLLLFTDGVETLAAVDLTEGDRFDDEVVVAAVGGGDGSLPRGVMTADFGVEVGSLLLLLLVLAIEGGLLLSLVALSLGDFMLLGG